MSLYEIDRAATQARLDAVTADGLRKLGECARRSEAIDKQVQAMFARQEREKLAMDDLVKQARQSKAPAKPKPATLSLGSEEFQEERDRRLSEPGPVSQQAAGGPAPHAAGHPAPHGMPDRAALAAQNRSPQQKPPGHPGPLNAAAGPGQQYGPGQQNSPARPTFQNSPGQRNSPGHQGSPGRPGQQNRPGQPNSPGQQSSPGRPAPQNRPGRLNPAGPTAPQPPGGPAADRPAPPASDQPPGPPPRRTLTLGAPEDREQEPPGTEATKEPVKERPKPRRRPPADADDDMSGRTWLR